MWKSYVGYKDDIADGPHPGPIENKDIIEFEEEKDPASHEIHLKDNLKEGDDYMILNPTLWKYLQGGYGGVPIRRFGILDPDTNETLIEVNLAKIYTYDVPVRESGQEIGALLVSRNMRLKDLRDILAKSRDEASTETKIWKIPRPTDIHKFYSELIIEFKNYSHC